MRKLYEKKEVTFAVLWIVVYCAVTIPIRGELGDESVWGTVALLAIAISATIFVKKNHLEDKYGLTGWPRDSRRYLYFIPMWFLSTGNLWGGFGIAYKGMSQVYAVISMLLIGYVEELIFRGFLFKALEAKDGLKEAVIISSVTFGIGHIVNLLAGQASLQTVVQVFFAIAWGFIFTFVFYKSGSLIPGIIAHGLVDAFSKFSKGYGVEAATTLDWVYMGVTILIAIVYGSYLAKLPPAKPDKA
ncbi:MAG: CPBP family intramembrane metalloprotease [Eubacteriales bacterium]|nr:CPBP family intramembrane metalloprotease [Eubacteriales bacterium]